MFGSPTENHSSIVNLHLIFLAFRSFNNSVNLALWELEKEKNALSFLLSFKTGWLWIWKSRMYKYRFNCFKHKLKIIINVEIHHNIAGVVFKTRRTHVKVFRLRGSDKILGQSKKLSPTIKGSLLKGSLLCIL